MYKIQNTSNEDNDYNANNVRNKIEDREPFAEGDGGYLYMEKDGKVRKVFKSKFAFEGESNVYKKTDGIPNVVKVYKILKRNMHIIMEFVPHNLENLIIGKEPDFDKFDKNKIVNELITGLISLHSRNIYHNDYKAKNVQITKDSGVRIIDFDLSDFDIINTKKRVEEINKLKYIILQILFKEKYYPNFYNNRKKFLEQIDDENFKKIMTFNRDNLKELQKYMVSVDFNNSGTLLNGATSVLSNKKKIYYLPKQNTKQNTNNTPKKSSKKENTQKQNTKKQNNKKENSKKQENSNNNSNNEDDFPPDTFFYGRLTEKVKNVDELVKIMSKGLKKYKKYMKTKENVDLSPEELKITLDSWFEHDSDRDNYFDYLVDEKSGNSFDNIADRIILASEGNMNTKKQNTKQNTKQNIKQNTNNSSKKSKLTKEILDKFFAEFKFKNEEECSSASYSSEYFIKKPILIKTINKKYPEVRAELPDGYQKLPKDKICSELFKLKKKFN